MDLRPRANNGRFVPNNNGRRGELGNLLESILNLFDTLIAIIRNLPFLLALYFLYKYLNLGNIIGDIFNNSICNCHKGCGENGSSKSGYFN